MQRLSPLRTAADPATRDAAFGELEVLVQRVSGGDADGAAAAMRSHLASVGAGPRNL